MSVTSRPIACSFARRSMRSSTVLVRSPSVWIVRLGAFAAMAVSRSRSTMSCGWCAPNPASRGIGIAPSSSMNSGSSSPSTSSPMRLPPMIPPIPPMNPALFWRPRSPTRLTDILRILSAYVQRRSTFMYRLGDSVSSSWRTSSSRFFSTELRISLFIG